MVRKKDFKELNRVVNIFNVILVINVNNYLL